VNSSKASILPSPGSAEDRGAAGDPGVTAVLARFARWGSSALLRDLDDGMNAAL
jgi:hypothetical protein